MHSCPICDRQFEKLQSLSIHYRNKHKGTAEQLAVKLLHGGIRPTCMCGCGEETKFFSITQGFGEWKKGHVSRVRNNWGHNKEALRKSHETTRKKYESGVLDVWNKGLTKESDPRIVKYGKAGSKSIMSNHDLRKRRSERMTMQRATGITMTPTGPDHPKWKGGTSQLGALCHGNNRLYQEWKFPKLQAANFKCERCGSSEQLHVHHDVELMSEIVNHYRWTLYPDIEGELDWNGKNVIVEAVVDHHLGEDVSGLVLCRSCHDDEHASLNF